MHRFSAALALLAPASLVAQDVAGAHAPVESARANPAIETLGTGTPGSRGVPTLSLGGVPVVGRPFALRLRNALPGGAGCVVWSDAGQELPLPQFGGELYPAPPYREVAFALDAAGTSPELLVQQPVDPALRGLQFFVQAAFLDGAAQGGVALTPGYRFAVGEDFERPLLPGAALQIGGGSGGVPGQLALGDLDRDEVPELVVVGGTVTGQLAVLGAGVGGRLEVLQEFTLNSPLGAGFGDVNGDGELDLVVSESVPNELVIYPGVGNRGFGDPTRIPLDRQADRLQVADFDRDGFADVVAHALPDAIVVRGRTGGGSEAPVLYDLPSSPRDLVATDWSGDSVLDLAFACEQSVALLRGLGDGSFAPSVELDTGGRPVALAFDDLDGDDVRDLVVAHEGSVAVALGLGQGDFAAARSFDSGGRVVDLAIVDLNEDRLQDLVIARRDPDRLAFLRGDGAGNFVLRDIGPTADRPGQLAVNDWDEDLFADLVVTTHGARPGVGVVQFSGVVDAPLALPRSVPVGGQPTAVEIADFDRDGIDDWAVADRAADAIVLRFGTGAGRFGAPVSLPSGALDCEHLLAADLNLDGFLDLFAAGADYQVFLGDGAGGFNLLEVQALGAIRDDQLELVDMDGDRLPDLVWAADGGVSVAPGRGDGRFGDFVPALSLSGQPGGMAVLQFDGDGIPDLAVTGPGVSPDETGWIYLLRGLGKLRYEFSAVITDAGPDPRRILAGDYNQDDETDLLVLGGARREVEAWFGVGNGTFVEGPKTTVGAGLGDLRAFASRDLDGDRLPDVVVVDRVGSALEVLVATGDGSFRWDGTFPTAAAPYALRLGDLDGDLLPDVLIANELSASVWLFRNQRLRGRR